MTKTRAMSVLLNGMTLENFHEIEFQKQMNEGNLPAKVQTWLNANGYFVDPEVVPFDFEDFEVDDTSEDCDLVDDFTPNADLYAKVASKASSNVLHVYDLDDDEYVDTILYFAEDHYLKYDNPSPSNIFAIDIAVQNTGTCAGVCNSYYCLLDDALDTWLWWKVDHEARKLYYSFDGITWVDTTVETGFTFTDEVFATLEVEITAVNKFKYNIDDVGWSSEKTNDNTYDTALVALQVLTEEENFITTPATGYEYFDYDLDGETFVGVTTATSLTGLNRWSAVSGATAGVVDATTFAFPVAKWADTSGAWWGNWYYMPPGFSTANDFTNMIEFMIRSTATNGPSCEMFFYDSTAGSAAFNFRLKNDGLIYLQSSLGVNFSANTWYYVQIYWNNNTHKCYCKLSTDGTNYTTYDNGGAYYAYTNNVNPAYVRFSTDSAATGTMYATNISVSWYDYTYPAGKAPSGVGTWEQSTGATQGCYADIITEGAYNILKCVDASASGGTGLQSLAFSTYGDADGNDWLEWEFKCTGEGYSVLIYETTGSGGAYKVGVRMNDDGKIYLNNLDSGYTWADNTWISVRVKFTSTSQSQLSIDGGANYCAAKNNVANFSAASNVVGKWTVSLSTPGTPTTYYRNIKPSWIYVAAYDTSYPVECWVDNISSDFFVGVGMDNIAGATIQLLQGSKQAWKGFVDQASKNVIQTDVHEIELSCFDELYHAAHNDIDITNIIHQSTVDSVDDNEINLVEAIGNQVDLGGKWCVIRHNAGQVDYNIDDDANYDNLKTTAFAFSKTKYAEHEVGAGSHADTQSKNNVFHLLKSKTTYVNGEHVYADYTLQRAAPSDRTIMGGQLRISGNASWYNGVGFSNAIMNAMVMTHDEEGNEIGYVYLGMVRQVPDGTNLYGNMFDLSFQMTKNMIVETGGNWQAKIRLEIHSGAGNFENYTEAHWYIDYIRVDVRASKDASYIPIEGKVDTVDDEDTFDMNSIPIADQNAAVGDTVFVCDSLHDSAKNFLNDSVNIIKNFGYPFGASPIDERSNDGLGAFKRLMSKNNTDWFLEVDEDPDARTILHADFNKRFFDGAMIKEESEILDDGFTLAGEIQLDVFKRYDTNENRVIMKRTNKIGSYLQFPYKYDGADFLHDTVYYPIAIDLDHDPDQSICALELYFSFTGTAPPAGDHARFLVFTFSPTDDIVNDSEMEINLSYIASGGSFDWKASLSSRSGNSDTESVQIDGNGTMGIRLEVDYSTGAATLYKRKVYLDGADRKLADTWVEVDNCSNVDAGTSPPRAIGMKDLSYAAGAWAFSYLNLHAMKIELDPETFSGGAVTPRGDIVHQVKYDRVRSILVIGAKDASGNELTFSKDIDTQGFKKVFMFPTMRSISELKRFVDEYYNKYEYNKNAILMKNYIDNSNVYHPGYTYTFTLDGVAYTEILRRASMSWEPQSNACKWELEFGKGHTFGREKMFNAIDKYKGDIRELQLR